MTEILDGVTLHEMVRVFFHVCGVFAFFKALSNSAQVKDLEDRLNRLERKTIWK